MGEVGGASTWSSQVPTQVTEPKLEDDPFPREEQPRGVPSASAREEQLTTWSALSSSHAERSAAACREAGEDLVGGSSSATRATW